MAIEIWLMPTLELLLVRFARTKLGPKTNHFKFSHEKSNIERIWKEMWREYKNQINERNKWQAQADLLKPSSRNRAVFILFYLVWKLPIKEIKIGNEIAKHLKIFQKNARQYPNNKSSRTPGGYSGGEGEPKESFLIFESLSISKNPENYLKTELRVVKNLFGLARTASNDRD